MRNVVLSSYVTCLELISGDGEDEEAGMKAADVVRKVRRW